MTTYEFHRQWVTRAPRTRVQQVLTDLEHYPEWWRQVVAVAKIDDDTARVLCRSTLPYTLDLVLHSERRTPELLEVRISGDLVGWSRFTLADAGAGEAGETAVSYAQEVVVAHRLPALAARLLRPVVRWNHDQMMRGCETGLQARTA